MYRLIECSVRLLTCDIIRIQRLLHKGNSPAIYSTYEQPRHHQAYDDGFFAARGVQFDESGHNPDCEKGVCQDVESNCAIMCSPTR